MLHFTIESRSSRTTVGPCVPCRHRAHDYLLPTLVVPSNERGKPLSVTFELVAEGLQCEPGVFWEPDGSFVWTVREPQTTRLEGQVADGATTLQHIELLGSVTRQMFDRLLQLARGVDSNEPLMFQLIRRGRLYRRSEHRATTF